MKDNIFEAIKYADFCSRFKELSYIVYAAHGREFINYEDDYYIGHYCDGDRKRHFKVFGKLIIREPGFVVRNVSRTLTYTWYVCTNRMWAAEFLKTESSMHCKTKEEAFMACWKHYKGLKC